jgi:hypothetical protein
MGRTSLALGSLLALGGATAACTVFSGVDDMELRTAASGTSPSPDAQDAAILNPFADAGLPDFFGTGSSGGTGTPGSADPNAGPATCGAEGSWRDCITTATVTTCAIQCAQQGFACVDSCCASDLIGDYAASVGQVYALASECSAKSLPSNATFGLCSDPAIVAGGLGQVRCCCK